MIKKLITDDKKYITTAQTREYIKPPLSLSGLQKYKRSGSRKTFYALDDIMAYVSANEVSSKTNEDVKKSTGHVDDILTLIAYVDGSYNKETKTYGSAAIITCDGTILVSKSEKGTRMNSMWNVAGEIAAAAIAVKLAEEFMPDHLIIRYDCEAIEKWPTGQWQVKNDYAAQYVKFMNKERAFDIVYEHVKAHTGDKYNEMADDMALKAAGVKTMQERFETYAHTDEKISNFTLSMQYQVSASCLKGIDDFYKKEKHAFKDYAALKVGNGDNFSRMWEENDFIEILPKHALDYIKKCLVERRDRLNAMRWMARGLRADDAVRKICVDNEIFSKK